MSALGPSATNGRSLRIVDTPFAGEAKGLIGNNVDRADVDGYSMWMVWLSWSRLARYRSLLGPIAFDSACWDRE